MVPSIWAPLYFEFNKIKGSIGGRGHVEYYFNSILFRRIICLLDILDKHQLVQLSFLKN